jgi:hypothetical protein
MVEDVMLRSALVAAAILCVAGAAVAGPAEPPAAAAAPAAASSAPAASYAPAKAKDQKDDQVVCHSEAVLGSRMPVRRCRTVREIKERTFNDREMVEHSQANLQWRSN